MEHINKKIRQMKTLKVVFKRHPKRAKSPTREHSVAFSSTQTSPFKCPSCTVKKTNAETQTTESDHKEVSASDAGVQVNITPTRIPRLLGTKYISSSDSSIASPPINHDAACQTHSRGDLSSDMETYHKKETLRPSSASANLNSSPNTNYNKYRSLLSSYSNASTTKDKNTKNYKTLNLQMKTNSVVKCYRSQNKGNASLKCNMPPLDRSNREHNDSENSADSAREGMNVQKQRHMRRSSSSSSGIPIHVKLRTLQSPNIHRTRAFHGECFSPGFVGSSANSSDLSSPTGDCVKASSGDDSDPSFWNTCQQYSALSETYTIEGAGDFSAMDLSTRSEVETSKTDITSPGSASGIRPPKVFLPEKK